MPTASQHRAPLERTFLAAVLVAALGVPLLVASVSVVLHAAGASASPVPIALGGSIAAILLGVLARAGRGPVDALARRLPAPWDGALGRRRAASVLCAILAVVGAGQLVRLSLFMADPALRGASAFPPVEAGVTHACMAAYVHAGDLSRRVNNVYAEEQYPAFLGGSLGHAPKVPSPVEHLSGWLEDAYEYPPPFLLLPRAALALTNDFSTMRTGWFALNLAVLALAVFVVARAVGGARGRVALLLTAAMAASLPILFNLQFGQFHFAAVALAMLGMVAFRDGRDLAGGALLGAAVVSKIFPGLLILVLLLQRRWRAVLATAAFCAAYALLGLMVLGWAPYAAFFGYQLPRIASGKAFSFFMRSDLTVAGNWGIFGLPIKLARLGVPGMTPAVGAALSWIYTVPLVAAAVVAARRKTPAELEPLVWLALLCLASLRSPLAPNVYTAAPALWLMTLMAIDTRGRAWAIALFVVAWIAIGGLPPLPTQAATILAWTCGQLAMLTIGFWVALRPRHGPSTDAL